MNSVTTSIGGKSIICTTGMLIHSGLPEKRKLEKEEGGDTVRMVVRGR